MAKTDRNKEVLVAQLRKTPIVQIACEKTAIGRTTYYRWRTEDEPFAKAADKAISDGTRLVNDMAESQLLAAIREGNMTGIIFWLKHHHSSYSTRVEVTARHQQVDEKLTPEQQAIVTEALRLSGLQLAEGTASQGSADESA